MADRILKITLDGETFSVPEGTTYLDLVRRKYPGDLGIVLVRENNDLRELNYAPRDDAEAVTVNTTTSGGIETYRRSTTLLFLKAMYDTIGYKKLKQVKVQFSVSRGYFCEVTAEDTNLNQELVDKVKACMQKMVEDDLPIEKESVPTAEAVKLFHRLGMYDKEKLFRFRRVSRVNIYKIDRFRDYFYGYMVPSTGYLKHFDLHLYEHGIVLQMPIKQKPDEVPPFEPQNKVSHALIESNEFSAKVGVDTVGDLNEAIVNGTIQELILVQEALQEQKIAEIARQIKERNGVKFVMIAGPSSSGKTTFSYRLSVQLRAHGLVPHPIGVDNYFVNREDNPKDEFGNYNFEDLESIDTALFDHDMNALLRGEEVELPYYNFKTGLREYRGEMLKLGANDILVVEGIHCLNEKLYATLPKENMYKVYISALTQLNVDEHNRVSTTDGRLIRRMVRDSMHRAITASQTLFRWESVRKGEEKNIFPFQETADVVFNSAQIYELAILKLYAEPLLFGVDKDSPEYSEAKRLLKFLDYFLPLLPEQIPSNSILQEFIGHSIFNV